MLGRGRATITCVNQLCMVAGRVTEGDMKEVEVGRLVE